MVEYRFCEGYGLNWQTGRLEHFTAWYRVESMPNNSVIWTRCPGIHFLGADILNAPVLSDAGRFLKKRPRRSRNGFDESEP
jgi:hypothetical protein